MLWMALGALPAFAGSYDDIQLSIEPVSLASTAAAARQPGLVAEAQLGSMRLANAAPADLGVAPFVPRLWVGVVEQTRSGAQWSVGLQGALLAPLRTSSFGSGAGLQGGIAFPGPAGRLWTGVDLDIGRFDFTSEDGRIRQFGAGAGWVVALRAGRRITLSGQFSGRLNRVVDEAAGEAGRTLRLEPRATIGASWVGDLFTTSLGLRAGLRDADAIRFPLALVLSESARFGQIDRCDEDEVEVEEDAPDEAPALSTALPSHPQLFCDPGTFAIGVPPPRGREAWCAREDEQGRLVRHGLYLRWHDDDTIAERGQYINDRRAGEWVLHGTDGTLIGRGPYLEGERHGLWVTWFDNGTMASQGSWYKGVPDGDWTYYTKAGVRIEGRWDRGVRDGEWLDYDASGTIIRRREFLSGQLIRSPE